MRANAIYTPTEGWDAVIRTAHARDAAATRPSGEYAQIRHALEQLRRAGDLHATLLVPAEARLWGPDGYVGPDRGRIAEALPAGGRFGIVTLPSIRSGATTSRAQLYAETALADIGIIQKRIHPCGWIVDVRENSGGDVVPMLLAVGPVLGSGPVIAFTGKRGIEYEITYRNGRLSTTPRDFVPSDPIPDLVPAPAVAVLTGPHTFSAGEAVMLAFRGRRQARSFGGVTGGGTGAPVHARLSDGAMVVFATSSMTDRNGNVYRGRIAPDVVTGSPVAAAERWLATTPACS